MILTSLGCGDILAPKLLPGLHSIHWPCVLLIAAFNLGMKTMSEYKVEKDLVPVKVFYSDGGIEEGGIYVSLRAAHHEGPESVKDVLNQEEPFLPVTFFDKPTKLVNKDQVLMVSFPRSGEKAESVAPASTLYEVSIHLINHLLLEGRFTFLLPPHSSRVKDYLSQEEPFVELGKDGEIYLVNKRHIIFVEEK